MASVVLCYFHSLILSKHLQKWLLTVTGWGRGGHQPNLDGHTAAHSHHSFAERSENLITTSLQTDPRNSETRSLSLCGQSQQQPSYFERRSRFTEQSRQYRPRHALPGLPSRSAPTSGRLEESSAGLAWLWQGLTSLWQQLGVVVASKTLDKMNLLPLLLKLQEASSGPWHPHSLQLCGQVVWCRPVPAALQGSRLISRRCGCAACKAQPGDWVCKTHLGDRCLEIPHECKSQQCTSHEYVLFSVFHMSMFCWVTLILLCNLYCLRLVGCKK